MVEKTSRELAEREEQVEGVISIGSGEVAAMDMVADICRNFRYKYPRVRFDMYTATAEVVKERMENGLIDIGLLLEPVDMDAFEFIRMPVQEKWVALMRPDDALAAKPSVTSHDLEPLPLILPRRLSVQSELANWFGDSFSRLNIVITGNLTTNGALMVQKGIGCAVVVEGVLPHWDQKKLTIRPLEPELSATTALAWRRAQPFSPATDKFIKYIKCLLGMDREYNLSI